MNWHLLKLSKRLQIIAEPSPYISFFFNFPRESAIVSSQKNHTKLVSFS